MAQPNSAPPQTTNATSFNPTNSSAEKTRAGSRTWMQKTAKALGLELPLRSSVAKPRLERHTSEAPRNWELATANSH